MPIQAQSADGTLHQFPDGTPDAVVDKAMKAYVASQPSVMDRIVASPVGRFLHDNIAAPIAGAINGPLGLGLQLGNAIPGNGSPVPSAPLPQHAPVNPDDPLGLGQSYQNSLARNRNTPGYTEVRSEADKAIALRGSGIKDQMLAPLLPTVAGTVGLAGGLDSSNAMADAQEAAQAGYQSRHPILSFGANALGGLLLGAPETRVAPAAISTMSGPGDAASAYVRGLGADPAKLRAAATAAGGKPITAAEAIGKPGEVGLGALARREGSTPDALSGTIRARSVAAPQRILSDYAAASGIDPLAARGDIEGFIEANQKAATPLYTEAYKANPNISSSMLDRILETPAGKKAFASAREKMQNDMSLMGTPDAELMDQAREGDTPIPSRGVASGMKLRVYDYVKKSLDDQIGAAYSAGNKNEGGIIKDLKNTMLRELDKADVTAAAGPNSVKPEGGLYAQARAKAGEYLSARKQFETGQEHILDANLPAKDFSDYYAKLGPADQQAYLGGVANKLFNLQQANKLKADIFKAPVIQRKLATIMGPQKAQQFLSNMETEAKMAGFARTRVPGAGSPTAEYTAAMKDQDGASALGMDALQVGNDLVRQGVRPAIGNLVMNKAKDAAATYLTRGMAIPVRDAAGQMLMAPPADLAKLLESLPQVPKQRPLQLPSLPNRGIYPYGALLSLPQLQRSVSGR